jgi:hypothetical protein
VVSSQREGAVVTLRARFDDGRVLVSAPAGLTPPEVGMRVAVEIADRAVVEVPTTAPPSASG